MNTTIIITIIICFTIICVVNMWTKTAESLFGGHSPHKKTDKFINYDIQTYKDVNRRRVNKNDDQS